MHLVDIPDNPVPSGAVCAAIRASDGVELRFARWRATGSPGLGTVCVFPGRTEFIEKYFEAVGDLRRRGFNVVVLDWRGQGLSQRLLGNRRKGYVDSFEDFDKDLAALMQQVVLPDCPPPFFAFAFSMGGNILMRNAARAPAWFDRQILVAPMLGFHDRFGSSPAVRILSEVVGLIGFGSAFIPFYGGETHASMVKFEGNTLTSDEERFRRSNRIVEAEPALGLGAPTIGWLNAAYATIGEVMESDFAQRVRVPTLIVAGGAEQVVSLKAIETMSFRLKNGSQIIVPGARHELLMERDLYRAQLWAAFDAFIPGSKLFD